MYLGGWKVGNSTRRAPALPALEYEAEVYQLPYFQHAFVSRYGRLRGRLGGVRAGVKDGEGGFGTRSGGVQEVGGWRG